MLEIHVLVDDRGGDRAVAELSLCEPNSAESDRDGRGQMSARVDTLLDTGRVGVNLPGELKSAPRERFAGSWIEEQRSPSSTSSRPSQE